MSPHCLQLTTQIQNVAIDGQLGSSNPTFVLLALFVPSLNLSSSASPQSAFTVLAAFGVAADSSSAQ